MRVEHGFVAVLLVPCFMEIVSVDAHVEIIEWSSILGFAVDSRNFAHQALDDVADCHSGRDAMRVDNHIRNHALHVEGEILLPVSHSTGPFLSVSRSKLVADLRYSH